MAFKRLTADVVKSIVTALTPRFLGRDQDHLLALADETVEAGYDIMFDHVEPLYDFRDDIQSPGGADMVGILDAGSYFAGSSVEDALQQIGPTLAGGPFQPLDGDLSALAAISTMGVYPKRTGTDTYVGQTPAQVKADLGLVKADVGLGNVDNTSDASKPVSTAQQTALNLKANLAGPTFTGVPAAPTATAGTNTTQLATTAFVTTADNLKANLASPTFTGDPKAPTPATADNDTSIATTAYVKAQGYAVDSGVVHVAGTETISGSKTFSLTLNVSNNLISNGSNSGYFWADRTTAVQGGWYSSANIVRYFHNGADRASISGVDGTVTAGSGKFSGRSYFIDSPFISNEPAAGAVVVYYNSSGTGDFGVISAYNYGIATYKDMVYDASSHYWRGSGVNRASMDNNGNFICRDVTASRGDGTGVIFLNASQNRYLFFDGTKYVMPGANVEAPNFVATSDRKLKKDITYLAPRDLSDLRLACWKWESDNSYGIGLIAQDTEVVAPQYVFGNSTKAIDKAGLALEAGIYAAQEIKELKRKVKELQDIVTQLGLGRKL